ncbi:MAG: phosphoglycerate dehydrogenase [Candidatus Eisenbacteria bacterium]|nr:phosphoglycerate dehydrogenase [Candidatus Eisenbacteria bacterium]
MAVLSASLEADAAPCASRAELLDRVARCDGLVVRSHTLVDRELLDRAPRLRVVGRAGVGVDNIDVAYATERGVMVVNAPESNIVSAAEHTLALMLALARDLPASDAALKGGEWPKPGRHGVELFGKTLGIVGLGRVGSMVAVRAAAFGMKVVAYDPYIALERFEAFGAERAETLDELVRRADYLSVHTPKTDETYGMVGARELALARPGLRVVNCARGGIVSEDALVDALRSGRVAAAGVDVFDHEPLTTHPLFSFPQVIVTPHLGGSTEEAQARVGVTVAEQVVEALGGRLPKHALNMPLPDSETMAFVRPFLPLAEAMGSAFTQLFGLPLGGVEVRFGGELGRYRTEIATSAFLKGLLASVEGDQVNLVNGRAVAKRRGIRVTESRTTECGAYTSLVTACGGDGRARTLSGTLLGRAGARITEVDGFEVDLPPSGDVVVCWFDARAVCEPGVVGRVGTLLGRAGLNISRMEVGREVVGERAIMVISLGDAAAPETLASLEGVEELCEVKLARFPGRDTWTHGRSS